jgi:hypothetical protein
MPPEPQPQNRIDPPIFITILILLAGLLGVLKVYYLTSGENLPIPKTDKAIPLATELIDNASTTASWKTYRNDQYGFEFKYPNKWVVQSAYSTKEVAQTDNLYLLPQEDLEYVGAGISFIIKNEDFIKNYNFENVGKISINNIEWTTADYKIKSGAVDMPTHYKYFYTINNNLYISMTAVDQNGIVYKEKEMGQILSTFKFISTSTPPINTASWKTYQSSLHEFEFKYPSNWKIEESLDPIFDIRIVYTTPGQNAMRGITYCEAYIDQSPRCEFYASFTIDWESGIASQVDSRGGLVTLVLKKATEANKTKFLQTLSTFKFINASE